MCGIAGIIGNKSPNKDTLKIFLESIAHRGPDHRGLYFSEKMMFGMNRLSIIDLKSGNQPMQTDDNKLVIIFNGEIYNYKDLRNEIGSRYNFKTFSDTEVILAGYSLYGKDFFKKLNGIYAIAIWDEKNKKLILSRDPRGVKPLYYGKKDCYIYFSSEVKSFINSNIFKNVNLESVSQYLSAGYIFNNDSSIQGVKQLYPGETLEIIENKIVNNFQLSNLVFDDTKKNKIKNLSFYVRNKLIESVERQLISDVPVGLLLSSGIDSMSILSCLKLLKRLDQTQTYTAYYPSKEFSENTLVEDLSKKWNFKNHSIKISSDEVFDNLDDIFKTFDNLDFMPVSVSKFIISKYSDNKNKVLLSGAGGDEIFCSYTTHIASEIYNKFNFIDFSIFKKLKPLLEVKKFDGSHLSFPEKIIRFIYGASSHKKYYHLAWRYIFNTDEIKNFGFIKDLKFEQIYKNQINYHKLFEDQTRLNLYSNLDLNTWLIDHALKLWDKAGMSNSIEIRVPFLDLKFLNDLNVISPKDRVNSVGSKKLLRNSFEDLLPKEVYKMPKKGFTVPVNDWLCDIKIKKKMRDLSYSLPRNFINHEYLDNLWNDFESSKGNQTYKLWILGSLSGWLNINKLNLNI